MVSINELKDLWQTVFGDERSFIDRWFETFYRPELSAVREASGSLAARAFVIPLGTLNGSPCASLYAVASIPERRGTGLGIAVTSDAVQCAEKAGFSHILLHPADHGLFRFYKKLGFVPAFPISEAWIQLPHAAFTEALCEPAQYLEARDTLLSANRSVRPSLPLLSFFSSTGGRLYIGDGFCAAVENEGNKAVFKELITDGRSLSPDSLASMASGAVSALVREPASDSGGFPFAMRYGTALSEECQWPGLMLD